MKLEANVTAGKWGPQGWDRGRRRFSQGQELNINHSGRMKSANENLSTQTAKPTGLNENHSVDFQLPKRTW